jgi:hypothetical protein
MNSRSNPIENFIKMAPLLLIAIFIAVPFFNGLQSGTHPWASQIKGSAAYKSETLVDKWSPKVEKTGSMSIITGELNK